MENPIAFTLAFSIGAILIGAFMAAYSAKTERVGATIFLAGITLFAGICIIAVVVVLSTYA